MADPDPMTCDPGSRVYDPDPGTVIPDPIYLVPTLNKDYISNTFTQNMIRYRTLEVSEKLFCHEPGVL